MLKKIIIKSLRRIGNCIYCFYFLSPRTSSEVKFSVERSIQSSWASCNLHCLTFRNQTGCAVFSGDGVLGLISRVTVQNVYCTVLPFRP